MVQRSTQKITQFIFMLLNCLPAVAAVADVVPVYVLQLCDTVQGDVEAALEGANLHTKFRENKTLVK